MKLFKRRTKIDPQIPDFENTEQAVEYVKKIFIELQTHLPYRWNIDGSTNLNIHLKKRGSWLPEPEFRFASGMMSDIWEIVSKTLLDQDSPGLYSQPKITEIFHKVNYYMLNLSEEFTGNEDECEQFAESVTHGMFLVLQHNAEFLAQPFLFRLSVVWVHSRNNYI
jgi:hypothetical protein